MTLMKDGPLPTFNKTIRSVLVKSIQETTGLYGISVQDEAQIVRKSISISGDYLAGIRVSGASFQGAVTLSMDKRIAKSFADKIFAGMPAKADDSMLCDLVGEVCNQITGSFQREMGALGCKLKVNAQETSQGQTSFDSGSHPDEWLMIPFVFENGRAVLAFGFVGELGLGLEETTEELSEAKNITFF